MNKTDVLNTIQSAHANLEELLAPLSESQLCTPTLEGNLRSIIYKQKWKKPGSIIPPRNE